MSPESGQELRKQEKIEHNQGTHTHKAAIRMSRSLFWTLLRERHIFTSAHAPMASQNVHSSVGCIHDVGMTVEKRDSASGDYGEISFGGMRAV